MRVIVLLKLIALILIIIGATGCAAATGAPQAISTPSPVPASANNEPTPTSTRITPTQPSVATSSNTEPTSTPEPATPTAPLPATETLDHADLLNQLLFEISTREEARAILDKIEDSGDTRFVAGLIDVLRYQRGFRVEIGQTLNALTGQELPPEWFAWVEWTGQNPEIEGFEGYVSFKANLFAQIDPNFLRFIHEDVRIAPDSRPEEIVWGGVPVDGIPALDNPQMIDPEGAAYLVPEERVFGVSINGDTRAYPARFLDWHEMFNDVVGGEPVSLAY